MYRFLKIEKKFSIASPYYTKTTLIISNCNLPLRRTENRFEWNANK